MRLAVGVEGVRSIALMGLLLSTSGAAQPIDTALVVLERDGQHTERSLRSWVELNEALGRAEPRLRVRGAEEQAERGATGRADAEVTGRALLATLERQRQSGDREGAMKTAAEALKAFERADWRTTQRAFVEALAWKGALQGSQAELSLLFTLEPSFVFPEGTVPEDTLQQVELQRQGKAKAARGTVVIDAVVPTLVWLDGAFVGMTPVTTSSLVAGRHRLSAFSPGLPLVQSVELLAPGGTVHLPIVSTDDAAALRASWAELVAGVRRGQPARLEPLLARSGANELLLVVLDEGGAEVWRLAERATTREVVKASSTEALVTAVRHLYDGGERSPEVRQPSTPAVGARRPFPLLLAAGGAALAAVGIGVFAASRGDLAAAQRVPQAETSVYAQAISRARVSTYSSYALLGVGVGLAVAGVVWWFLQPEAAVAVVPNVEGFAVLGRW